MDRFRWCSDQVEYEGSTNAAIGEESLVTQQPGVRLYDGEERTQFDNGVLRLTTHRILWSNPSGSASTTSILALPLAAVLNVRCEEGGGWVRNRTPKLVLRLLSVAALENALAALPHPLPWMDRWGRDGSLYAIVSHSDKTFIKLGFTRTGEKEFARALDEVLKVKLWATQHTNATNTRRPLGSMGIGAIQRQQAARLGATDRQLEEAFEDLGKLMSRASEMVTVSRNLAKRSRETSDGDLTTNEIIELRATMLSMGILDDLNPRSTIANSGPACFHEKLSQQLSNLLTPMLEERAQGCGCVDLATAYCRLNRARGLQLVSPDDLLRACQLLEQQKLPLRLKRFPSGLLILQLASENEEDTFQATAKLVEDRCSLTAEELARAISLPVFLARERLLTVEERGLICRDDSEAGLRFYPNRFLLTPTD